MAICPTCKANPHDANGDLCVCDTPWCERCDRPVRPQGFTRTLRNEPITVAFDGYHPGELGGGIRGYSDTVTVSVDSGDPGGDKGEMTDFMQQRLIEWFDGSVVSGGSGSVWISTENASISKHGRG